MKHPPHSVNRWRLAAVAKQFALSGVALVTLCGATWYPEHRLSGTRAIGELSASRDFAAPVAYDGGFFTLWEDSRHAPSRVCQLYGTRMTPQGAVVDSSGFRWTADGLGGSDPRGACIGTSCLVTWQQHGAGVWTRLFDATTGTTTAPLFHSLPMSSYHMPFVATDGTQYLLVWVDGGLMGQLLTAGGALLGPQRSLVLNAGADFPTIAASGSSFLVVWVNRTNDSVNAQLVSSAGLPQGSNLVLGTLTPSYVYGPPVVGVVGTTYLVAWMDGNGRLAMRRVSQAGVSLDASAVIALGNSRFRSAPVVLPDPPHFVLAWLEGGALQAGRVRESDLGVVTAATTLMGLSGWLMRGASMPLTGQALLTWSSQDDPLPRQVHSTMLVFDAGFSVTDAEISQTTPDVHEFPRIARADGGFWVGYGSRGNGVGLPLALWVDNTGAVSPTALLSLDSANGDYRSLDLTPENTGVRAVWVGGADVHTCYINALGQASNPATSVGATGTSINFTRASHLGTSSLLAWVEDMAGTWRIAGRLIDASGALLGASPFTIRTDTNRFDGLALVASNSQYGLSWVLNGSAYFARLDAAGSVVGSPLGPFGTNIFSVSLATDSVNFLWIWNSSVRDEVFASRVSAAGDLIDSTPMLVGGSTISAPSGGIMPIAFPETTFDGLDYQVIWSDDSADGGGLDVRMRRIFTDGGMGATMTLAGGPGLQTSPHIQAGSPGRLLTVWVDSDEGVNDVSRVRTRAFADLVDGQPCLGSNECRSGTCATVCCDIADGGCNGLLDAGTDAGMNDGGNLDAGVSDGGNLDAGVSDGGAPDGGTNDGGPSISPEPRTFRITCGCGAAESDLGGLVSVFWLLTYSRGRRTRLVIRTEMPKDAPA